MYLSFQFFRNFTIVLIVFSSQFAFSQAPAKWSVNGNATVNGDFLGTTNNNPVIFYANNQEWMRLKADGDLKINNLGGFGNGFVTANNNGVLGNTPFTNDTNQVLTGAGTFRSISSFGGMWQQSGNNVFLPSGKVGIGTNSPNYKLDVNGNARVTGTLHASGLVLASRMEADTIKGTSMVVVNNNLNLSAGLLNDVFVNTGDLRLQSKVGYNGNTVLNAGTSGNVGIGVYNPVAKLDVNGNVRVSGILTFPAMATGVPMQVFMDANGNLLPIPNPPSCSSYSIIDWNTRGNINTDENLDFVGTCDQAALIFRTSNLERMRITATGKVGVGTNNPHGDFQVGNNVQKVTLGSSYGIVGSTGNTFSNAYLGFNVARTAPGQWETENDGGGNGGVVLLGDMGGGFRVIGIPSTGATNQTLSDMNIADNTQFYVRNDGRVVIGKETMVNGPHDATSTKLTVDGTVICRELYVTQNDWADSVFYSNYYLMPLDSVADFIKVNGHLPGVPSQQEVITNGSNLGQNDVILLAKIEELTIYMIELQKEIETLKKNQAIEVQTEPK